MSITALDPQQQEFQPLFPDQTEDVILARMIGWANEGLDPIADADLWVDTREGGHWRTCITPIVQELARLYDLAGTDVPMSGMVLWAWGTYLDDLAAVWDVQRRAATYATGVLTFTGPAGTMIDAGVTVAVVPSTPDDPAPEFSVTIGAAIGGGGTVDLPVQCTEAGAFGDVAANSITYITTPGLGAVSANNGAPTSSGSDPETDDSLRTRLLQAIAGKGPGAVADYIRWAQATPGVGRVYVVPIWNGPGSVLVMVTDVNGEPLSSAIVTGLQNTLDPVAGQGEGIAPIGATVTVETNTLLAIDVVATFVWETGYSWDGAAGTIAAGPAIEKAISQYLLTVPPGGSVVYEKISGIIATTLGVHDISAVTVNGAAVNVAVALTPTPKAPYLHSFTAH